MTEAYTPSPVVPAFPLTLPVDGEIINHAVLLDGMIKPALDYTAAAIAGATATDVANMALLAKQTASSGDTLIGVLTYAGGSLTLPTGTLRAVLQYIANTAATRVMSRVTLSASSSTIDGTYDVYLVPTIAADIVVSLKTTAPLPMTGRRVRISRIGDTTHQVDIQNEAGALIGNFGGGVDAFDWIDVEFNGATWDPTAWDDGVV